MAYRKIPTAFQPTYQPHYMKVPQAFSRDNIILGKWSVVPDSRSILVIEEKQGFKCKEPEAGLWKILLSIRYVKL